MDEDRFDDFSRSLAARSSRRGALRVFGAGGVAGAFLAAARGSASSAPAPIECRFSIAAAVAVGPNQGTAYDGTLSVTMLASGGINQGSLVTKQGDNFKLVGQAAGRALILLVNLGGGKELALTGAAEQPIALCTGRVSGTFGGPDAGDLGTWSATANPKTASQPTAVSGNTSGGSSGNATGSNGNASSGGGSGSSGNASGGASGNSSGSGGNASSGSGGGGCASGVVCGGVCCAPAAGLTADQITCNQGFCQCSYSCASAGCPNANVSGTIVNDCGTDPQPHCHSECNAPDNGCGNITCPAGQTLDQDTCACMPAASGNAGNGG